MTATILRFQRPYRTKAGYHTRSPGELTSRRLYLTGKRTTPEDAAARAWELYSQGAPCWKAPACVDRLGHAGTCTLPKAAEPDRESGVFLADGAQITEVEEA